MQTTYNTDFEGHFGKKPNTQLEETETEINRNSEETKIIALEIMKTY